LRSLPEPSSARRRRTAVFAGCACFALVGSAAGQSRLELAWDAPPECPQGPAVRQKVDALLGAAAPKMGPLRAEGRIVRADGRYRLTLRVHDESRVRDRTIDADACADLAGAAAVALGLLLRGGSDGLGAGELPPVDSASPNPTDPSAARQATDAQNASANGSTNPASSTKNPNAASAAAASHPEEASPTPNDATTGDDLPRSWNVLVRAPVVQLDVGRLPKPSVGLGAGVGFRYGDWRVLVSGRIFFDQTVWSELASPDVGAEVHRAALDLAACRGFRWGAVELEPCLTIGLDHLAARGVGTDIVPQSERSNSLVLGAAGAVRFHAADWLALVATAGVGIETSRPKLTVTSLGEVQQLGPVAFSLALGPEWIF
jgi:hypothetical protein